jgi:hypothetical protein
MVEVEVNYLPLLKVAMKNLLSLKVAIKNLPSLKVLLKNLPSLRMPLKNLRSLKVPLKNPPLLKYLNFDFLLKSSYTLPSLLLIGQCMLHTGCLLRHYILYFPLETRSSLFDSVYMCKWLSVFKNSVNCTSAPMLRPSQIKFERREQWPQLKTKFDWYICWLKRPSPIGILPTPTFTMAFYTSLQNNGQALASPNLKQVLDSPGGGHPVA